jgi:hypothetical protein
MFWAGSGLTPYFGAATVTAESVGRRVELVSGESDLNGSIGMM